MKLLISLFTLLLSFESFAGGSSGGGGGPRPRMDVFAMNGGDHTISGLGNYIKKQSSGVLTDFVKAESINQNTIVFWYSPHETKAIQVHNIQINDLDDKFRKALEKSIKSQKWESISIEQ